MRWQLWREQGGLLTSSSFVPMALFTSLTLAFLMLATIWSCEEENAATMRREAAALQAALSAEREHLVVQAALLARTDEDVGGAAAEPPPGRSRDSPLFHEVFAVDLAANATPQDERRGGAERFAQLRPAFGSVLARYGAREFGVLRGSLNNEPAALSTLHVSGGVADGESFFIRDADHIDAVAIVPLASTLRSAPAVLV